MTGPVKREAAVVTREEFRRDPGKVWDRVDREGAIAIVDSQGRRRSVLHAMRDEEAGGGTVSWTHGLADGISGPDAERSEAAVQAALRGDGEFRPYADYRAERLARGRPTPAAKAAKAIEDTLAASTGVHLSREESASLLAAWRGIVAQATLDACEQAEPRVRQDERERIVRAVDRLAPPNFQLGAIGRYVRSVVARAADMPIETASERGLAVDAAREEGLALGRSLARTETLLRVVADVREMAEGQPCHAVWTLEELAARLEAEAAGVAREPNRCT